MRSTERQITAPGRTERGTSGVSDLALIRRVQQGDRSAFDLLVAKYQHKILNLVMRYVKDPSEALDVARRIVRCAADEALEGCGVGKDTFDQGGELLEPSPDDVRTGEREEVGEAPVDGHKAPIGRDQHHTLASCI